MYPDVIFLGLTLYDICILVGVICALVVARVYMDREKISAALENTVIIGAAVAVIGGFGAAVLFQAFYNYLEDGVFVINAGTGMTFYGGVIGGAAIFLAIYFIFGRIFAKDEYLVKFYRIMDMAACGILVAHAFGRIGCFTAGCCYGAETDSFIGVLFPGHAHKVIPTQLIESAFLFIMFIVLSKLYFKKKTNLFAIYIMSYGAFRFAIEFLRGDDRGASLISWLSPSQFVAILMIIVGAAILIFRYVKAKRE